MTPEFRAQDPKYCNHSHTKKATDGSVSCLFCGKMLERARGSRPCPECQAQTYCVDNGYIKCVKCEKVFPTEEPEKCPICHSSSRVTMKGASYTTNRKTLKLYCHKCRCEFRRDYGRSDSDDPPRRSPPPAFSSGNTTWSSQGQTNAADTTKPQWGVQDDGYSYSSFKCQVGKCRVCGGVVKVYGKKAGYCSTCKESVFPIIPNARPFVFEGSL